MGLENLLNSTNHTPKEIVEAWIPICTYHRRQLETLVNNREDPMFDAVRYHFLNKSKFIQPAPGLLLYNRLPVNYYTTGLLLNCTFLFIFLVVQCSAAGFPEFLMENLLTYIYGTIDCDGCVRRPGDSDETIQVLTAETASILAISMRLTQEESNGLTVYT